jgi:hypothetical protein
MPEFPALSGEATFVISMTGDPDPYNVTMGFVFEDPLDGDATAAAFGAAWADDVQTSMTSLSHLIRVVLHYTDSGVDHEHDWSGSIAGGGGPGVLPQNCALLVRKNTGLAGRKGKGRMYIPAILAEGNVDAVGNIDAGTVAALQGHMNDFYGHLNDITNVSTALLHGDGSDPTFITGFSVQPVIATQRRRLR